MQAEDFERLQQMTGHMYRLTVLKEGGVIPFFHGIKRNMVIVTGAFFIGALLFYQSLFIAEIRVDGYQSLEEREIRTTLAEAGVFEGARKQGDYAAAKDLIYRTYDTVTWVSFYEEGRLLHVDLAEGSPYHKTSEKEKNVPVNIIASQAGLIRQILPLQGNAVVQNGEYVNKGDLLISGRYRYHSSDYSRGDQEFIKYVHAGGRVLAKVPCHLAYYFEKKNREKEETGDYFTGISVRLGDLHVDTTRGWGEYEASVRTEKRVIDLVRPLPLSVRLVTVKEVSLSEREAAPEALQKKAEAALRTYEKTSLKEGERILGQEITWEETEGLRKADVLLEVERDIGMEQKIETK